MALIAGLGLASCETAVPVPATAPPERPSTPVAAPTEPSEVSRATAAHFARVQSDLLARGLLRSDGGGPDVPFSQRQLVENFVQIALYDEYVARNGALVAQTTESRLRRWEEPVRLGITFGASIPEAQRNQDRKDIAAYAARLSRVSGLPIGVTSPEAANFHVLVLNEDERRAYAPQLRRLAPGIDETAVRTITGMPRSTLCLVFAFSRGNASNYSRAVAVIRGEHPDLLRLSCIHEELAQGLGLANDSPAARPSIFNDDEEFALLTNHDELLLKMLYDPRLRPGMQVAEARPILRQIASELLGGES
ncbi:MAG: hypothetical protein CL814_16470 [Confluentimicrobium sp.]|nr:hypothetical protein [Actibacterium sp.]